MLAHVAGPHRVARRSVVQQLAVGLFGRSVRAGARDQGIKRRIGAKHRMHARSATRVRASASGGVRAAQAAMQRCRGGGRSADAKANGMQRDRKCRSTGTCGSTIYSASVSVGEPVGLVCTRLLPSCSASLRSSLRSLGFPHHIELSRVVTVHQANDEMDKSRPRLRVQARCRPVRESVEQAAGAGPAGCRVRAPAAM